MKNLLKCLWCVPIICTYTTVTPRSLAGAEKKQSAFEQMLARAQVKTNPYDLMRSAAEEHKTPAQIAYEKVKKEFGIKEKAKTKTKRSPLSSKTDQYKATNEQYYIKELYPILEKLDYDNTENPNGIFSNYKIYFKYRDSTNFPQHITIAKKIRKLINDLTKKIIDLNRKQNVRGKKFSDYLKSKVFQEEQTELSEELIKRIENAHGFLTARLLTYKDLSSWDKSRARDAMKILKNVRKEVQKFSKEKLTNELSLNRRIDGSKAYEEQHKRLYQ